MVQVGKRIGQRLYLHIDQLLCVSPNISSIVAKAQEILRRRQDVRFNIVRLSENEEEVAFLDYANLGNDPFPALMTSWRVHLSSELVTYRSYAESLNPPILHRTELFLPADHPSRSALEELTNACESVALFEHPKRIGFRHQWEVLLREKGYALSDMQLIPLGNHIPEADEFGPGTSSASISIDRHLTALSRTSLSAPVQSLIRDRLLTRDCSFFDYGCGKGDDLKALQLAGFKGAGWDPHFCSSGERRPAEVVNLGFVINVIEKREERIEALERAYALATRVLAVAAMVSATALDHGHCFADGTRTSRNTFQKYYTQAELQHFIESVLEEDAYPAAPGVFYVFRDRVAEQRYLVSRTQNRSRVARARLAFIRARKTKPPPMQLPTVASTTAEAELCMAQLWNLCLELGRVPDVMEVTNAPELEAHFGTAKRALAVCVARNDADALRAAALSRQGDILVMIARHFFERRRNLRLADTRLKRDVRVFFGSLRVAEAKARELLCSVQDTVSIRDACKQAMSQGLGWFEEEHSLQLHTSLVERLPAILRVYIGCATALAGSLAGWDLVKLHVESGKVTLMSFDDFAGQPLPKLMSRLKIRLRDQELDLFEYGASFSPPTLYNKSRYINEEFPRYAEQVEFEEALSSLELVDLSGYGPPTRDFYEVLSNNRWEISGFTLHRSRKIPDLTDRCGKTFCYADLIYCSETWKRLRMDNVPRLVETYNALFDLARRILDPVVEYFGRIKLTYGFASHALSRQITRGIAPRLDQHASCEVSPSGQPICARLGASVDFIVEDEDMRVVAQWIAANCHFERIYFYGSSRPLHVSIGAASVKEVYEFTCVEGRKIPRKVDFGVPAGVPGEPEYGE